MRKLITALSVAAVTAAAIAMPTLASAQESGQYSTGYAGPVAGAVVGTAVGVGLYEGWFGTNAALAGSALPTTAAGAATVGGVAGVGTVALIDSVFQPCRGFHALFGANKDACVNGERSLRGFPRRLFYCSRLVILRRALLDHWPRHGTRGMRQREYAGDLGALPDR
jgi:hypothetical protein